jgi:hypothetical protein
VLHVIKPEHPLPLDPEFYLNRVDAGTLIGMGYRDARAYLDSILPEGVAKDASCTAMTEPPPGVRFNDTLRGDIGGSPLTFRATVVLPTATVAGPPRFTGYIDHAGVGGRAFVAGGRVESDGDQVTYRGKVRLGDAWQALNVTRTLHDDPGPDAWIDSRRAELTLGDARTEVTMTLADAAGLLASVEPVGAHGFVDRAGAAAGFAANGLRELLRRY